MSNTNNQDNNISESEKKNFTEILSDKAEKAGESAGEAVKKFTEMLTSKDREELENNTRLEEYQPMLMQN